MTATGLSGTNQTPSNGVDVYDGAPGPSTYLCTAFIGGGGNGQSSGNCSINDTTLDSGLYSITAVYQGDNNFNGSTSASHHLTVAQVNTQIQAFPVPGYALYGAEKGNFFIVGVGGNNNNGNPTGSVSITANGVSLVAPGSCPTNKGGGNPCYIDSATVLPVSATPYQVTLSYPGDMNFTPATTTVPLSIFPATSSVVLTVSPASTSYGDESSATLSATVTSGTTGSPTGSVTLQDGGDAVCTIALQTNRPEYSRGELPITAGDSTPAWDVRVDRQLSRWRKLPELRFVRAEPEHCERLQPGLLGGGLRRRHLLLRNRPLLWVDRWDPLERPDRRDRLDP